MEFLAFFSLLVREQAVGTILRLQMTHGDQAKATWLLLFPCVSGCSHHFALGWGGSGDGHQLCEGLGQPLVVGEEKM